MTKIIFKPLKGLQSRQLEIAKDILNTPVSETKYFGLRASRQSGKTHLIVRIGAYLGASHYNQVGAIIMATNAQTRKVFRAMSRGGLKQLIEKTNNTDGSRYIELINGTMIMFYSSGSYDSVAGNSFDFMIGDEFALWNPRAWGIIRPTLAAKPNAKVILASTPRGKNDFYNVCINGMDDKNTFYKHYRMSWRDNKYYDKREIEDAKKTMTTQLFNQEYEGEFVTGSGGVFGEFKIVQTLTKYAECVEGEKYFFGIDWAGQGADKTILTIVNSKGEVCLIYKIDKGTTPVQCRELAPVIKKWKAVGYGEQNGMGASGCELLSEDEISLYKLTNDNTMKQLLVSQTLEDIADENIALPTADLCPDLDNEMSMYESKRTPTGKLTYSHPDGMHDDYVDSFMMANKARRDLISTGYTAPMAREYQKERRRKSSLYRSR